MIIPFTERTRCYLSPSPLPPLCPSLSLSRFLSCSFILLCLVVQLFISIAETCSRAWKAASCRSIDLTPAIVRSIDVFFFFFLFFFFFYRHNVIPQSRVSRANATRAVPTIADGNRTIVNPFFTAKDRYLD